MKSPLPAFLLINWKAVFYWAEKCLQAAGCRQKQKGRSGRCKRIWTGKGASYSHSKTGASGFAVGIVELYLPYVFGKTFMSFLPDFSLQHSSNTGKETAFREKDTRGSFSYETEIFMRTQDISGKCRDRKLFAGHWPLFPFCANFIFAIKNTYNN